MSQASKTVFCNSEDEGISNFEKLSRGKIMKQYRTNQSVVFFSTTLGIALFLLGQSLAPCSLITTINEVRSNLNTLLILSDEFYMMFAPSVEPARALIHIFRILKFAVIF